MWLVKWRIVECCFCPIIKPVEVLLNCLIFLETGNDDPIQSVVRLQFGDLDNITPMFWCQYNVRVSRFSFYVNLPQYFYTSDSTSAIFLHAIVIESLIVFPVYSGYLNDLVWTEIHRKLLTRLHSLLSRQVKRITHHKRCSHWSWLKIMRRYECLLLKSRPCMTYVNDVANRNQ
jgi:hypothetical protein